MKNKSLSPSHLPQSLIVFSRLCPPLSHCHGEPLIFFLHDFIAAQLSSFILARKSGVGGGSISGCRWAKMSATKRATYRQHLGRESLAEAWDSRTTGRMEGRSCSARGWFIYIGIVWLLDLAVGLWTLGMKKKGTVFCPG